MTIYRATKIVETDYYIDWVEDSREEFGLFSSPEIAMRHIKQATKGRKILGEDKNHIRYRSGKKTEITFIIRPVEIE